MAYQTINPANGEVGPTFPDHTSAEVEAALQQAQQAYLTWRDVDIDARSAVLRKAANILRARLDEYSRLITIEMGKLRKESDGEVTLTADIFDYYADNASAMLAPKPIAQQDGSAVVKSQPIGALFGIEPWNFPYYQLVRFVAPNLMLGNVVLLKHAPSVPQCANLFETLMLEAGAPPGVYTNLRLSDDQAAVVIADMRIRGVALTGSNRAGASVAASAGKAMKRSTMELGGSDPFIVLEDANLEKAIEWSVWSRLLNCGQGCVDAKRFIVVAPLYDRFLKGVRAAVEQQVIGDPFDDHTTVGPICSERAKKTLLDQVQRAVDGGATLVMGAKSIERPGSYVAPGILTDIRPGNPAYREEFFGPVFLVFKAQDEAEAIRLANDTEFGLSAAIFSEDVPRAHKLADQIDAGMVFINHGSWTAPELPFGGVKNSGYGRELGELGIAEFVNKKLVRTQDAQSTAL